MTRRIRDFMTNTNTGELTNADLQNSNQQGNDPSAEINRNFGVPLDKCESASTSPVIMPCLYLLYFGLNQCCDFVI